MRVRQLLSHSSGMPDMVPRNLQLRRRQIKLLRDHVAYRARAEAQELWAELNSSGQDVKARAGAPNDSARN